MIDWTEVNLPVMEAPPDVFRLGTLIEFADGRRLLIGGWFYPGQKPALNLSFSVDDIVRRYRVLWDGE